MKNPATRSPRALSPWRWIFVSAALAISPAVAAEGCPAPGSPGDIATIALIEKKLTRAKRRRAPPPWAPPAELYLLALKPNFTSIPWKRTEGVGATLHAETTGNTQQAAPKIVRPEVGPDVVGVPTAVIIVQTDQNEPSSRTVADGARENAKASS